MIELVNFEVQYIARMSARMVEKSNRHPADWYRETARDVEIAHLHLRQGINARSGTNRTVDYSNRVKDSQEVFVKDAMKRNQKDISRLQHMLEDASSKTNHEIRSLKQLADHLKDRKYKVDANLQRSLERRKMRNSRPGRELTVDAPEQELTTQTDLLAATSSELGSQIAQVEQQIRNLEGMSNTLQRDIAGKKAASNIEERVMHLGMEAPRAAEPLYHDQPNLHVAEWRTYTLQNCGHALDLQRQSKEMRRQALMISKKARSEEKEQHHLVQAAMKHRIKEVQSLKADLSAHEQLVEQEVAQLMDTRRTLEQEIKAKLPHLNRAAERYASRLQRPAGEKKADKVEFALVEQYHQLQKVMKEMENKLAKVKSRLHVLQKTKVDLKRNYYDKAKGIKVDGDVYAAYPSRPTTSAGSAISSVDGNCRTIRSAASSFCGRVTNPRPMTAEK